MGSDLRDRLDDLARHTPPASPPPELWSRGVRRSRVTRTTTGALALVVLALVGIGVRTWHSTTAPQPADTGGTVRVPDRLFTPSPWLKSFPGDPGRLIAVIPALRRTLRHTENGFVGVTASTNTYGFLSLPGIASANAALSDLVSLSPDGRRLAYWVSDGTTRGTPHGAKPVTGLDVLDLVDGTVERWRPETTHGLSPSDLTWAGGDMLIFDCGQWVKGGASDGGEATGLGARLWRLGQHDPVPLAQSTGRPTFGVSVTATGHWLVRPGSDRVWLTDLDGSPPPRRIDSYKADVGPYVDPSGTTLVGLPTSDSLTLVTGTVPATNGDIGDYRLVRLQNLREIYQIDGWLDDDHLVASVGLLRDPRSAALVSIDVRSGAVDTLIRDSVTAQVATDLLGTPPVPAKAPPSPHDPRWVLGGSLAALVLCGLALWGIRARRA